MIISSMTACYLAIFPLLAAGPGVVEEDPFSQAFRVFHFSFENQEDQDFDDYPDDWTRRKGPQFPHYINVQIDREQGQHGRQSLRYDLNGGKVANYSPPVRVDPQQSYVFEGYIRTQLLKYDAALISVSILNLQHERLQRFLTRPVTGTHQDWVRVRIAPIEPHPDACYVVVGCHLVHNEKMDIRGRVWFDSLSFGKLPQLKLDTNFYSHFVRHSAPIHIKSQISGLDRRQNYRLHLELADRNGKILEKVAYPLKPKPTPLSSHKSNSPDDPPLTFGPRTIVWELPSQPPGFYRARSMLERNGESILEKNTTFAVMTLTNNRFRGEFGWSIANSVENIPLAELADIAAQAGINWLKYPLWQSLSPADVERPAQISHLFDRLVTRGITPVGLLNHPPQELSKHLSDRWMGTREIFMLPTKAWAPSLEPLIARYSPLVRYWQLGSEKDFSFVGTEKLPQTIDLVKQQVDKVGRDSQIGMAWNWNNPLPSQKDLSHLFLSIHCPSTMTADQLIDKLKETDNTTSHRWVLLEPLAKSKHEPQRRCAHLVKQMVASKIGKAEAIVASDVFDPQHGLLNSDGSPALLFLPWRTTALALKGKQFFGSITMPGGSQNYLFANENEAVLVVWNDQPTREEIYLGEEATVLDVWGRPQPDSVQEDKKRIIHAGPVPKIVRQCSPAVARWRLALHFQKGRLRSEYGAQRETLLGKNTFPQGVNGHASLNVPDRWNVEPRRWPLQFAGNEDFQLPLRMTLPTYVSLGNVRLSVDFQIVADRPHKFRVYLPYRVGWGDVLLKVKERKLEDGRLEVEQLITNETSPPETLNFRCNLFIPGRKRRKKVVTKLGEGEDRRIYRIPNADELKGQTLWLRAQQVNGRRILNYRWTVGQDENDQ